MALDSPDPLEMVMNIEEAFHITIPDDDAVQIRTVGELYTYVLAKLTQPPSPGCISSATFYQLRRTLQELFAVPPSASGRRPGWKTSYPGKGGRSTGRGSPGP